MKSNDTGLNGKAGEGGKTFKNNCLASCQKVLARIANAREAIFNESFEVLKAHERLLRLALNEAEAVARQTLYPHLVFLDLAREKVQAVIAWDRQQSLRRGSMHAGPQTRRVAGAF
jgi:hypothetical protein